MTKAIGRLGVIGWIEGVSFRLLLSVAMPLKYIWEGELRRMARGAFVPVTLSVWS